MSVRYSSKLNCTGVCVCGVQQPAKLYWGSVSVGYSSQLNCTGGLCLWGTAASKCSTCAKDRHSMFVQNLLDYIVKVKGKVVHISAMKAPGGVEV